MLFRSVRNKAVHLPQLRDDLLGFMTLFRRSDRLLLSHDLDQGGRIQWGDQKPIMSLSKRAKSTTLGEKSADIRRMWARASAVALERAIDASPAPVRDRRWLATSKRRCPRADCRGATKMSRFRIRTSGAISVGATLCVGVSGFEIADMNSGYVQEYTFVGGGVGISFTLIGGTLLSDWTEIGRAHV